MKSAFPAREDQPQPAEPVARVQRHQADGVAAGWLFTPDGRLVTGGTVTLRTAGDGWAARITRLDRPGMVATLYFAEGLRDVSLTLADGRSARARIASTTFLASAERVCELTGLEPLA
jgi:hypothetical protein